MGIEGDDLLCVSLLNMTDMLIVYVVLWVGAEKFSLDVDF